MYKINENIKEFRIDYYIVLIFNLMTISLLNISPMIIIKIVDSVKNKNEFEFYTYIFLLTFLYIIYSILTYFNGIFKINFFEKVKIKIKNRIVNNLINQKVNKNIEKDKYISQILNEVEIIEVKYLETIINIYSSLLSILISIYLLFNINKYVLFTLIIILLLNLFLPNLYIKHITQINKVNILDLEKYTSKIKNIISSYKYLYRLNSENLFYKKIDTENQNLFLSNKNKIKVETFYDLLQLFLKFFTNNLQIIVLFILFINEQVTIGTFTAVSMIYFNLFSAIKTFNNNKSDFIVGNDLIDSIYKEKIDKLNKSIKNIESIEFKDFTLSIQNREIFNNFNYKFEKNKKYLIIGKSGSGKSSLIKVIMKLYNDYLGSVYINDENIQNLNIEDIYSNISYITSLNYIFDTSLENNINIFSDNKNICLEKYLEKFNLENDLIEKNINNDNISTGQKQRIDIIRNLTLEKDIIILDEATSNLDTNNRKIIDEHIFNLNKTIIYITHFINSEDLSKFDYIINLDAK